MAVLESTNGMEGAIWGRLLHPNNAPLSVEAARSLLRLDFPPEDKQRMHELALKCRKEHLSARTGRGQELRASWKPSEPIAVESAATAEEENHVERFGALSADGLRPHQTGLEEGSVPLRILPDAAKFR